MTSQLTAGSLLTATDYDQDSYSCEFLVVGTGAGGSVAGALLAEAGRDVILLEEGSDHSRDRSDAANISGALRDMYRNTAIFPILGRPTIPHAEARCLGGGTTVNGALIWRTPPWILEEWSRPGIGLDGYGPDDLAPVFDTIESDLGVKVHTLESDANLDSLRLKQGADALGWNVAMAPRAVERCLNVNLCPIGCFECGKQSTTRNYLPRATAAGARIFSQCRAVKIVHSKGTARKAVANVMGLGGRRSIEVSFDHLVLAGGATQTPHLIRRSGMGRAAGRKLQFHMNLKIVALFDEPIDAQNGTIFTVQVQEFARDGLLIMASNMQPHFLVTTAGHHGNETLDHLLRNYRRSAIFVAMIRPHSYARITSLLGDTPMAWYGFDRRDLPQIVEALRKTASVLFAGGAIELLLPVTGSTPVRNHNELESILDRVKANKLEITSVHAMASCPMGGPGTDSVVDELGRLRGMSNVLVTDASVLPSNMGESPQGTIMAMAHKIVRGLLDG